MNKKRLPDPVWIDRPKALANLAKSLQREPLLAVDTESNSLFAYQEQVCLIQFSTPSADYLVDPLALADLSPLAPLFSDPKIEKIFHAAEYDLLCLQRDFGFTCRNLFDTMVAARILGQEAVGLGAMLSASFGVRQNKRYQRANWGQRPLPADLLDYARLDTHYLIPLREQLKTQLVEKNLLPLAQEDFSRLCAVEHHDDGTDTGNGVDCWRVKGSYDLTPQQAAVLGELCQYRDQKARQLDRPLFKVVGDKTLLTIAEETPDTLEQLGKIKGMSPRQVKRHGEQLLRAVRRGLQAEPLHPPRSRRPEPDYLERLENLRQWRKRAAQMMGVQSDVVLPRDLLYALANDNPSSQAELAQILAATPWRLEHFGEQILTVLNHRE